MDETEVMRQKIQELEAEVRELKAMLPKEKSPSRAMFPAAIAEKHGGLRKQGTAWEYNHTAFMSYKDLMDLSKIIRRCCFLRKKKDRTYISADSYGCRTKKLECDTAKTLKEMTDEEYAKYCEALDKCLDVFQVYGCEQNINW